MEQINKVELRGNVGNVRIKDVGNTRVAQLTVATNYVYKGADGCTVIETTWHNVSAFEGGNVRDLDRLSKGCKVHLVGRLRNQRYTAADGTERSTVDIIAGSIEVID